MTVIRGNRLTPRQTKTGVRVVRPDVCWVRVNLGGGPGRRPTRRFAAVRHTQERASRRFRVRRWLVVVREQRVVGCPAR